MRPVTVVRGRVAGKVPSTWTANRSHSLLQIAAIVVFLAAWQATSLALPAIYISTPVGVVQAFAALLARGTLETAFISSLGEMGVGMLIAGVFGISLGVLMGRIRILERCLDPIVHFLNATALIAVLPLFEIWFGVGATARIAFIAVISVLPMVINTLGGIRSVDKNYREVGSAFGLSGTQRTRWVYVPAAMPYILVGVRISLSHALVGMILAGQEIGQAGLGGLFNIFSTYYETADMIADILLTMALALFLFHLLRWIERRFYPWVGGLATGQR
jgi:ABC-type nitrate/sulfonate/bicarbonate transport system permease component